LGRDGSDEHRQNEGGVDDPKWDGSVVWFDVEVLEIGAAREVHGQGPRTLGLALTLGQDVGNGCDTRSLFQQGLLDRSPEFLGAVVVE